MMRQLEIVGIGYPSIDNIIRLDGMVESGKTTIITNDNSKDIFYGGCVVNICYLLATLQHRCGIVMSVGEDFESSGFSEFLQEASIDLSLVNRCSGIKTSYTTLLTTEDGNHCTLFYPGAMGKDTNTHYDFDRLNAQWGLVTIGNLQANMNFVDACIEKKIPLIFSMKGDFSVLSKEYLEKVFVNSKIIFMNRQEFDGLSLYLGRDLLSYFDESALELLVITDGEKGSTILSPAACVAVPAFTSIEVVDTAGGGDAYIAGFLHELMMGKEALECGLGGSCLSSFIIEKYGCLTNIPSQEAYENRKNQLKEML